jgi:hypothetical protein
MVGTKIAILKIMLNTWDFSSTRLLTQGMTHPQKCFRQTITLRRLFLIILTNIFCFYFLRLMLTDGDGPRFLWILNSKLKAVKTCQYNYIQSSEGGRRINCRNFLYISYMSQYGHCPTQFYYNSSTMIDIYSIMQDDPLTLHFFPTSLSSQNKNNSFTETGCYIPQKLHTF